MYVKAPPRLGSSSATAAVITDAAKVAPRPAAHNPALNIIAFLREFSDRVGGSLPIEPDRRQILIKVMARADFPAFDIRSVWHDPVPPQQEHGMCLVIKHIFLKVAHQRALPCRIGLVQHSLIEIDLLLVVEIAVILGEHRARQVPLNIERRIWHIVAISNEGDLKVTFPHCVAPWSVGTTRCVTLGPILLHSSSTQVPLRIMEPGGGAIRKFGI